MNRVITIAYESKEKAGEVLSNMAKCIEEYGSITVAELYKLSGHDSNIKYMDHKYGWTDMSKTHMKIEKDGTCYVKFGKPSIVF